MKCCMHPRFCHNILTISQGDYTPMPRMAFPHRFLTPLYQKAFNALSTLRRDIARREKELAYLKAEMTRWQKVTNGRVIASRPQTAKRRHLDWGALLRELPARFTTKDVAAKTAKPLPQVYSRIWQWTKDKKITKDKTGYRKLSPAGQ
jgi:hypothetical protein